MSRLNQAVDIIASLTLPEPFAGYTRQLVTTWGHVQMVVHQKLSMGNVSGALDTLIYGYQHISHVVAMFRPEAIAGRFAVEYMHQLDLIVNEVKEIIDDLFWWGVGLGGATILGAALLGYWLHSTGRLVPLVSKGANLIPQVRAARMAMGGTKIRMRSRKKPRT